MWVTQRHEIAFLKSLKQKSNFSETFEWQEILRRKTNKSYDKTAVQNDPGNNTKKIVNLILENAMPKAIIEVYFELLVRFLRSDFLQLLFKVCENYSHHHASSIHYCVCLCKFSRIYQNVFISYMSHQLRTKIMAQLNFVQRLQISNQKSLVTIFIKTVSDVSAHASYKYPVNRCFEWAWFFYILFIYHGNDVF